MEAEALLSHGESSQVLSVLTGLSAPSDRASAISIFSLRALAYTRLHQFDDANPQLHEAEELCAVASEASCAELFRARGLLEIEQGRLGQAERYLNQSLASARAHHDRFLESAALLNLGFFSLHTAHFDDAVDWSNSALRVSTELSAQRIKQAAVGNLGWAYYKLGDSEKGLKSFLAAEQSAEQLGDDIGRVIWLTAIAYVHLDRADYGNAERVYQESLSLAKQIEAKEYIRNALIPLALAYERQGKFEQAISYADQAVASARADHNRLDELYALLVKGQVAAALHDSAKAESIFREVANDPQSDSSLKWEAQHSLARLEEDQGQRAPARREYEAALCTFETARSSVHHEESKLPFFTNAARIYDDYISFLIRSGQSRRALEVADYSRGRTLAEGLGLIRDERCAAPPLNAESVAASTNAIILYYWLGQQQSYMWAITKSGVRNFVLPPAAQINESVRRYREALVNGEDVLGSANQDGIWVYQQLVAPAMSLTEAERRTAPQRLKPVSWVSSGGTAGSRALPSSIASNSSAHPANKVTRVVVVPDGTLNSLNFETLLAPGESALHYWIEDATITNVQSLRLLLAEKSMSDKNVRPTPKVLLIGNAVPHPPEFPALTNAKLEMQNIEKHFAPTAVTQYTQSSATAAAFLDTKPEQYDYIHFVAHAVASSQVPLDSAVILSPVPGEDSFKLYARDIIQHHLHARLVTVSACNGAGTRSYNGEGLIGLSWAFLRAGARNTIAALWEVNDASTPQLMDRFYGELQQGRRPDVALRDAKLALIHSSTLLSKPFYWAPFQLYGTS